MTEPIHDMHAEQATLGGCLLRTEVALDVMDALKPQDFYTPRHEVIFESIVRLVNANKPTDVIACMDDLILRGQLAQAGGPDYLHSLTSAVPVAVQAPFYAAIVHDKAVRRRIYESAATTLTEAATLDLASLIETARTRIDQAEGNARRAVTFIGDLFEEVIADAERPRRVYPSPWQGLNSTLGGGFRPGGLYILAARPGLGKTAVALQIATHLTKSGPVSFSSLEMPKEELTRRVIAQGVQMPHHLLEMGQPMPDIWKARIETWLTGGAPHALAIDDRSTVSMGDVRLQARAVQRPSGRIAGVVVDYLQLMGGPVGAKRIEVVSENARQAKLLARELDCPVIMLSQLNRESEKRMDKRPQLSDLRDSGAIEQDADVVMMLYRDMDAEPSQAGTVPRPLPLELNVAKNRHGPPLLHSLQWEGSQMRAFE